MKKVPGPVFVKYPDVKHLYRYFDSRGYEDQAGNQCPRIYLAIHPVLRHTRCGVWIKDHQYKERFVNLDPGGRKYAYERESEARQSYIRRKQRQLQHLNAQLDHVSKVGELILDGKWPETTAQPVIYKNPDPFGTGPASFEINPPGRIS